MFTVPVPSGVMDVNGGFCPNLVIFEATPSDLETFWEALADFCSIEPLEKVPETSFLAPERRYNPADTKIKLTKNRFF